MFMKEIYMTDYVKIFSSFLKENQIKINEPRDLLRRQE